MEVSSRLIFNQGGTMSECISCDEELPKNECSNSKRNCGHHCNHVWTHDECCWCGKEFKEEVI